MFITGRPSGYAIFRRDCHALNAALRTVCRGMLIADRVKGVSASSALLVAVSDRPISAARYAASATPPEAAISGRWRASIVARRSSLPATMRSIAVVGAALQRTGRRAKNDEEGIACIHHCDDNARWSTAAVGLN